MADIVVTAANVGLTYPEKSRGRTFSHKAGVAITAGQVVYLTSAGTLALADASASGTAKPHFVALDSGGAGQTIRVVEAGVIAGYTFSQDIGATIYLSDTAGAFADAAGTVSAVAGRVTCTTSGDKLFLFTGGN